MTQLNPNKETIRRICSMFKCNECWLLNQGESLSLLVQLETSVLTTFKQELESWSGNEFTVINYDSESTIQANIKQNGELLLPVESNVVLQDIEKRRKTIHKKAD